MEKFFRLLYYYVTGGIFLFVLYLCAALAFSPKTDAKKRGFIPCTENFVLSVSECEAGTLGCPLKALWQDTKCNLYVIFDNLGGWIRGTAPSPWSEYFFTPVVQAQIDEEEPYTGDVVQDIENVEKKRIFLKARQKELQDAKNRKMNFSDEVLVPENYTDESGGEYVGKPEAEPENSGGAAAIADEAFMENFSDKTPEEKAEVSENKTVNSEGEKENDK